MQKDKVKTPPVPLDTGRGGVNYTFYAKGLYRLKF